MDSWQLSQWPLCLRPIRVEAREAEQSILLGCLCSSALHSGNQLPAATLWLGPGGYEAPSPVLCWEMRATLGNIIKRFPIKVFCTLQFPIPNVFWTTSPPFPALCSIGPSPGSIRREGLSLNFRNSVRAALVLGLDQIPCSLGSLEPCSVPQDRAMCLNIQ